jgi:RimJ/RimL family protein N-acetyltransferase
MPEPISFTPLLLPEQEAELIQFLTSEEWPFHVNPKLTPEKVRGMIHEGSFSGTNHECFWITQDSERVGYIRLIDLDDVDDGFPLFDLRLRAEHRGRGLGKLAVQWIAETLFKKYPELDRIAGTTRVDNLAMRKIFASCLFAKEGHYRQDWRTPEGKHLDTIKYGLLRRDWETGTITPVEWHN